MSIITQMLGRNVALHTWKAFSESSEAGGQPFAYAMSKSPEKLAKAIFAQLSHTAVVQLVAQEFDSLAPQVRLELRELCNNGNASGNVRKNVQRLDDLLKGKLLRDKETAVFVNQRVESQDGVSYKRKRVRESEAAAQRKYANR